MYVWKRCLLSLLSLVAVGWSSASGNEQRSDTEQRAYVSILMTDDFVLPARVLGRSLKLANVSDPFVVLCTEQVSETACAALRRSGIQTIRVNHIDTPQLTTHADAKFQYTRLLLWSLTNYTSIVAIDLDVLVVDNVDELFRCGSFCATLRHSDKFNMGVTVIRPDVKVFKDMLAKYSLLPSYDGGDQGFMNSYFWTLKYAPMFNTSDMSWPQTGVYRMSSAYNYDVAMYYVQSRMLLQPKIIHYTLGPTKPWLWWTYPMFDLNWRWLEVRNRLYEEDNERFIDVLIVIEEAAILVSLFIAVKLLNKLLPTSEKFRCSFVCENDFKILLPVFHLAAIALAFFSVPPLRSPGLSWSVFVVNQMLFLLFLVFLKQRWCRGQSLEFFRSVEFFLVSSLSVLGIWILFVCTPRFGTRFKFVLGGGPLWFIFMFLLCVRVQNSVTTERLKYSKLTSKT